MPVPHTAANDFLDDYLTIAYAAIALAELGRHYSTRQVRRWADDGKLPFFKDPSGVRLISKTELFAHFRHLQTEAIEKAA